MPYRVERRATCPPDRPFAVVLESDDTVVACHATRAGAQRQIAAIYAAEGDIEKQQPSSSQVHVDTIMGGSHRRRKPHYQPSVLIKGDYVGHPFRGNQWVDASGAGRGALGGPITRGIAQLEPTSSAEEARSTGRPLAVLQPENYPPAAKAALTANRQAAAAMTALHAKHGDDYAKIEADPDYAIIKTALAVTTMQARIAVQTAYAESLGFVVIQPNADGTVPKEGEYAYEYVDRDPEGRLRRSEEVARDSEISGESALVKFSGSLAVDALVLANPDGTATVLWGSTSEALTAQDARADSFTSIDKVSLSDLFGRRIGFYRDEREGNDGVLSGSRGGAAARVSLVAEAARLGIGIPTIEMPPRMSAKPLVDAGVDREDIGATIGHLDNVGRAFMLHRSLVTEDSWRNRYEEHARESSLAAQAEAVTPDVEISVTVPQSAVAKILKDGRLKTQFETGKSGGKNVPALREDWEALMFGYVRGMPPEARPIYGMVETGGAKPSSARGNEQYGTVTLVLKDSVKDRATMTQFDSLFTNAQHVPVREASTRLAGYPMVAPPRTPYYETQIHGGVSTADIERVIIDRSTYKDFAWTTVEPSAALLKALDKAGIPYEIRDGRAEKQAAEAVGKQRIKPSVLIKGDYVGHPFRGNQWVDSSGAGRSVASSTRASGHPSDRLLSGVREYRVHPVEALPSRWAPTLFVDGKPTTLQGRVSHHTKAKAERELVKFQEQTEALLAKTTAVKEVEGTDRPLTEIDTEVNGRRTLQRIGWGEEGRVEALEQYSRNSIELNRRLRSGELADGPLDEYMSGGSTMAVYRSISNDRGTADRIASELEGGATVIDRGYASTSRKLVEAQQMDAVGDGIILRIVMPSGSPRIEVPDGVGFDQDEVILPRNTALRPTGKVTTDDEGRRVFDVEVVDDADVQKALLSVLKGDYEGHPFRGNQWMDASGVSRGNAGSSPDQDRQAYEMRAAGQSWEQIARTLGYANGGSVRRLAMRHEARLKAEGGGVEVKPQPEPEKPPVAPQTGYVNGLRAASSDPYVAAAEGRPLQGWVTFSPAIQARLDARDVALVEQAALEREARDLAEAHLETLTPEERKQQRSYARLEAIEWALENNPEFARKYDAWQARGGFPDVNQLVSDMKDELMVAAGITRRTPEQIASMLADAKILDDYNQPREVRDAARQRLEAQGTSLEYFDEHREGGKGGRLQVTPHSLRLRYHSWDREADAKFGRQFLVEFDITGLRARGYSDQQIGDIIRTAERVAADRTYTPTYFAVRNNLKTLAEAEARQNEAIGALEEQVKDAPVSITVPPRILAQVLNEGRYKTQFETRKSGGYNSPQSRQEEEADRFGYPPHMAVEQRPVYGMVETGGVTAPSVRENLQYGSAVIVLKPEVRERTTFTLGDSLSNNKPSAPLTNPRAVPAVLGFDDYIPTADQIRSKGAYLEAQIHGGVRSSDIAYVVFEVGADVIGTGVRDEGQKIGVSKPPSPALLKSLAKAGIPHVIVPAGGEVKPPVGKSRGLYFGPTVLVKGDYEGHPFRGNQWTDAAGATQDASNLGRQDRIEAATIAEKINEKTSNLLVADATITAYPEGLPAALRNKYDKELMNIDVNDPDMINGISLAAAAVEGDNHVVTLNLKDGELAGALQMSQSPSDRFDGFKAFKMFDLGSTFIVDGAGSALFGYAVRRAAANGAGLTLEPLDKKAVAFWKSMGFTSRFTPIGYSQNYFQTMEMSPAMVAEIASGLDPDETSES